MNEFVAEIIVKTMDGDDNIEFAFFDNDVAWVSMSGYIKMRVTFEMSSEDAEIIMEIVPNMTWEETYAMASKYGKMKWS